MSEDRSEKEITKGPLIGIRHVQILLLFFHISCVFMGNMNISVTVVAMTNAASTNPDFPEFNWSEKEKNYIISSMFWGYILTQFPAGYLIRLFGAKLVLLVCTFCNAIITLLTPYTVMKGSWQALCSIRVVQGLFHGTLFPSINDHIANWSPQEERYVLGAITYSALNFGILLFMLFPGLIASSSLGWPGVFYISGGLCFLWCILWLIFGSNSPKTSRFITTAECQYIETSLKREDTFQKKKIPVPWRAMFTSVPFIALIFVQCAEMWRTTTLQTQMPSYMNGVLNMKIKSNALFSSLPYICGWIIMFVYTFLGKMIVHKGWLTLTTMRKIFNTIGMCIPAIVLIIIGFLDSSNTNLVITLLIVSACADAATALGCGLGIIDISPNHASVVMGIINPIASIQPLISPLVVGFVVRDVHERSEWQIVFGISALISLLGSLIYLIFGTSEAQPWDAPDYLHKSNSEVDNVKKDAKV